MKTEIVGIDPGFGGFKAAIAGAQPRTAHVSSVVGVGSTDLGDLQVGIRRRRTGVPVCVQWDGVEYLVGDNVAQYAQPSERMDMNKLCEGQEIRALTYTILGTLLGKGEFFIQPLIGVPVEMLANRDLAREVKRNLKSWLVGQHRFSVSGQETFVQIDQVRLAAQPVGAYHAWGLDEYGRLAREFEEYEDPVAIADAGFNTLDLFVAQNGVVVKRFTSGAAVGIRRGAETLGRLIRESFGIRVGLHEADALIRTNDPYVVTPEGRCDISALVAMAKTMLTGEVLRFFEDAQWGNGRQFRHLLLTGGGSQMLKDALLSQFPHAIVLPNPVLANAVGLARFAMTLWRPGAN